MSGSVMSPYVVVKSASGAVRLGDVQRLVVVKTASGAVSVGEAAGDIHLIGASSDMTIERTLATVAVRSHRAMCGSRMPRAAR